MKRMYPGRQSARATYPEPCVASSREEVKSRDWGGGGGEDEMLEVNKTCDMYKPGARESEIGISKQGQHEGLSC